MRLASLTLLALVGATATRASADAPVGFATLDNTGEPSKVEVRGVYGSTDSGGSRYRADVVGQYVARAGLGGYVAIAIGGSDGPQSGQGGDAISHLQLGALGQRRLGDDVDLAVRLGVILPTGSPSMELSYLSGTTRVYFPSDLATASRDVTWVRVGVSPTLHDGPVFLRADAAVDLAALDRAPYHPDAIAHVNLGAGLGNDRVSAALELQSTWVLGKEPSYDDEQMRFHTGALSVRLRAGGTTPYVAVLRPLGDSARGTSFGGMIGVAAGL